MIKKSLIGLFGIFMLNAVSAAGYTPGDLLSSFGNVNVNTFAFVVFFFIFFMFFQVALSKFFKYSSGEKNPGMTTIASLLLAGLCVYGLHQIGFDITPYLPWLQVLPGGVFGVILIAMGFFIVVMIVRNILGFKKHVGAGKKS